MTTTFRQPGDTLEWTNDLGASVSSGQVVVIGSLLGVAATNLGTSSTGTVNLLGVYTVPKVAGNAWAVGTNLTWDLSESKFDTSANITSATGDVSKNAVAFQSVSANGTTGLAKLNCDVGDICAP